MMANVYFVSSDNPPVADHMDSVKIEKMIHRVKNDISLYTNTIFLYQAKLTKYIIFPNAPPVLLS